MTLSYQRAAIDSSVPYRENFEIKLPLRSQEMHFPVSLTLRISSDFFLVSYTIWPPVFGGIAPVA